MDGGAWWAAVHGVARVKHDWATSLSLSCIGEGNGNPLQCSCLKNPRDRGAWWAAVYGVAQSRTRLKRLSSSSSSKHILQKTVWVGTFFQITSIRKYHKESYVYRVTYYVQDYKESSGNFSTSRREYCFFSGVLKLSTFYCHLFYSRSHWSVFRNQNFK